MRYLLACIGLCMALNTYAQRTPLPHGMIFGTKPDTSVVLDAAKLDSSMDRRNRISTIIKGRVLRVTDTQNGWFEMEAGKGKLISARFKNDGIKLPSALKGRVVIIQGIAARKMEAVNGKPAGTVVKNVKDPEKTRDGTIPLIFEVAGLMVYQ
ncbi:DUF4920 domain-containing protein [Mucilaginibacter auburnensis]|uniref:Uncharacterized protein DUF4920 n=1 Tax=Mucilaginibacter auburnensis TaxID=1457233 RepID=A0A2H9VR39_9SPHI|nr:DUF4920 domain-containing protein [Mucilaginibacter auburnensis]PJJ83263.1 uncharacterized protein DUF4920 [Mucilaginibacter auburnensis]